MKIAILGNGNMGAPLAELAQKAGHQVESATSKFDPVALIDNADLVILATKYDQALALASQPQVRRALTGKTVIDITNPLAADYMSLTVGHTSSAAEEIAKLLPGAKLVKAFNTLFANVLAKRAAGKPVTIPVFIAGDDSEVKAQVTKLVSDMGLTPIEAGALSNARYLEPMAELMIQLGYGLGHGPLVGFNLINEAEA